MARDEAGPDSDVDALVEFDKPVGLFAFLGLKEYLEQILGRTVDLPDALIARTSATTIRVGMAGR